MIEGVVNDRLEAVVPLHVVGPSGAERDIDAVLDTGFSDHLALPLDVVEGLGLPLLASADVRLADGGIVFLPTYRVVVLWDGSPREVVAYGVGVGSALIGMAMIEDHLLVVEAVRGSAISIRAI